MLYRFYAMLEARRERLRRQHEEEFVRQAEAELLRRFPYEQGYEWGIPIVIQGRRLPRSRRLRRRAPARRRRREEPEEEPEPEEGGDVIYL